MSAWLDAEGRAVVELHGAEQQPQRRCHARRHVNVVHMTRNPREIDKKLNQFFVRDSSKSEW